MLLFFRKYVQYAKQRVSYQQHLINSDSLRQLKTQVEDSMRMLLTAENEISLRGLQNLAARHSEITEDIAKQSVLLQDQQERLADFTEQASYEWMMQNEQ